MRRSYGLRVSACARLFATTALVAASIAPLGLRAQETAPVDGADDGLTDIIVTATRSSESIQKVPISIQALSTETLSDRQVKGLSDFTTLLPSVSIAGIGPGRSTPYFRGVVPAGGTYASVGYYLDDIPITGTGIPDIYIYDIERIEALSGPQGTLYGAGSLAGTIRVITNKPKLNTFEFGADTQVNKFGKGDFGGAISAFVNTPISETIAIRAMGFYSKEGGYVDNKPNNGRFADGSPAVLNLGDSNPATSFALNNSAIAEDDYNPVETYGGRLSLLWEPAEGWEITPMISAQRQIAKGYFGFDPRVGDLEVHDYDLTRQDDKWLQAQMTINGQIGDWDLVAATGYFHRKTDLRNDYTYYTVTYDGFGPGFEPYLQFFDKSGCTGSGATLRCSKLLNPTQYFEGFQTRKKFTQEVRVTTPDSWPFDATIGGFYHWQKNNNNNYYAIHGLSDIAGYTDAGGGNNPAGFGIPTTAGGTMLVPSAPGYLSAAVKNDGFYIVEQDQTYNDYAIFAEGHYDITPTLKATAGIRYFWTDFAVVGFAGVNFSAINTVTSFNVPTGTQGCVLPLPAARLQCLNTNFRAPDQTGRYKEEGETHKFALDWQFSPSKMVYANYSTGFRPGGFNRPLRVRGFGPVDVDPFQSEDLSNFELGVKTTWNNMFRFNAAVYVEKWNNMQYSVVVAGTQGAGMTGNAGKALIKGIEYDAELKLGKFTIMSNGAYNDGKLDGDFCNFTLNRATAAITQLPTCTPGAFRDGVSEVAAGDGVRLPRQPKYKGTSSVRYDTEFGATKFYAQGAALYQTGATQDLTVSDNNLLTCLDKAAAETAANRVCTTPGFISFDFSAGIKKDNWTLDLFIQNAFDKRGELTRNTFCSIDFCANSARTFMIRPQFFGIKAGYRY